MNLRFAVLILIAGSAFAGPMAAGMCFAQSQGATILPEKASVYARMSAKSAIVATLVKGQSVTVQMTLTGESGCWLDITWQQQSVSHGYVPCQDVRQPSLSESHPYVEIPGPRASTGAARSAASAPANAASSRATAGAIALTHLRVIDGTGAPAKDDQNIVIEHGRIREIGDAARTGLAGVIRTVDLRGHSAFPGLVGMHDHLFYTVPPGPEERNMLASFPRLYLAAGVTSIRTAGAVDLRADLWLKQQIDSGKELGPRVYPSAYLDGEPRSPENPARLARLVEQLAGARIHSIKVYTQVRRSELAAIVQSAHQNGLRVTGHLCAVGFTEAAAAGIDNLEHGLIVDTEFYSGKQPGICPDQTSVQSELVQMDVLGPRIQDLIRNLVRRRVAITSTLAVFETFSGTRIPRLDGRTVAMLSPDLQSRYMTKLASVAAGRDWIAGALLRKEMEFEREFVRAGGLLMAGVDPTGWGGVVAGFGDQREIELLVEAGFTPEQAIQIGTNNGALFLGQSDQFGTLSKGKRADIVVVRGDPSADIRDIRQTAIVLKDGVGYDPGAILRDLAGRVSQ